jgi:hypothetical protein
MAGYFASPNEIIDSGKNHQMEGELHTEGSGFYKLRTFTGQLQKVPPQYYGRNYY